jgi:hypothetical protein
MSTRPPCSKAIRIVLIPVRRDHTMGLRTRGIHFVLLAAVILTGCGGKGTSPVQGVITLEGTPVAGATVLFMPDGTEGGRPASGYTSSDGMFRLTTYRPDDGALSGAYRVVIQKTNAATDPGEVERTAMERARAKFEGRSLPAARKPALPEVYARFETTPLRCTVPVTGVVTLDLHRDGKQ